MESTDIHLSNQKNTENKIKSIKSFGISEPVSKSIPITLDSTNTLITG